MAFDIVTAVLASSLAASGTLTISYPTGRSKGNYSLNTGKHVLTANGTTYKAPTDFTLTFNANASSITLTWGAGKPTLAAGTTLRIQMERRGENDSDNLKKPIPASVKATQAALVVLDLGSPNVLDADGICAAQAIAGAANATINGALASSGAVTLDVPRGVQAVSASASDTSQTVTFTGTDVYGVAMTEVLSLNGTTAVLGKKAFKTVTQVAVSAAMAGNLTAGSSDVLGLPVFVPSTGSILKEMQDGAAPTAGTVVAGSVAKATNATGDVRGTYDPNAACDGDKGFVLVAALADPTNLGVTQA